MDVSGLFLWASSRLIHILNRAFRKQCIWAVFSLLYPTKLALLNYSWNVFMIHIELIKKKKNQIHSFEEHFYLLQKDKDYVFHNVTHNLLYKDPCYGCLSGFTVREKNGYLYKWLLLTWFASFFTWAARKPTAKFSAWSWKLVYLGVLILFCSKSMFCLCTQNCYFMLCLYYATTAAKSLSVMFECMWPYQL